MGVPVIEAPCEAEATCAALARAGLVFAAGSEDMDTLTLQVSRRESMMMTMTLTMCVADARAVASLDHGRSAQNADTGDLAGRRAQRARVQHQRIC